MDKQDTGRADLLNLAEDLGREIAARGASLGLPYVAVAADIGSPEPPRGADGRPMAETLFRWLDPDLRYWEDRGFALRAAFVRAARVFSEPVYFKAGRFGAWRPSPVLEAFMQEGPFEDFGVGAAIVAPAYLPRGVIGAVVWATPDAEFDVAGVFDREAASLQALALKFVATYAEATLPTPDVGAARLTRREIQCLKWAAAGKTDVEISLIVGIALPTVRFHVNNASRKLGVTGRGQAVRQAALLGYIGAEHQARRAG